MLTQITTLEALLNLHPEMTGYDMSESPNNYVVAMTQWANQSLLGDNLNFWITGDLTSTASYSSTYRNMKDLDMNFNVPPEFVKSGVITVEQALALS